MFRVGPVISGPVGSLSVVVPAEPRRCAIIRPDDVLVVDPVSGAAESLYAGRRVATLAADRSLAITAARELTGPGPPRDRGTIPPGADRWWLAADGARLLVSEPQGPEAAPRGWRYRLLDASTLQILAEHLDPAYGWVTPDAGFSRFAIRSKGSVIWDARARTVTRLPLARTAFPYFSADLRETRWFTSAHGDKKRGDGEHNVVRVWTEGARRVRTIALPATAGTVNRYWFATRDGHLSGDVVFWQEWSAAVGHALSAFDVRQGELVRCAPLGSGWSVCTDGTLPGIVPSPSGEWAAVGLARHEPPLAPRSATRLMIMKLRGVAPRARLEALPADPALASLALAPVAATDAWLAAVDTAPERAADAVVFYVDDHG